MLRFDTNRTLMNHAQIPIDDVRDTAGSENDFLKLTLSYGDPKDGSFNLPKSFAMTLIFTPAR